MEDLVLVKEIKREGCYCNFVMQSTYASPSHGLERLARRKPMAQDVTKARLILARLEK